MRDLEMTTSPDDTALHEIARRLDDGAAARDAGTAPIRPALLALREVGLLDDDGTPDPALTARRLMRIGAADLSVGRLWEGHMNALYLAQIHGDAQARAAVQALVADGAILGVWGADGAVPVAPGADGLTLDGSKVFASGLGTVTHAVVTVSSGPQVRLGIVDATDWGRADPAPWQMPGMQATASGHYDLQGTALCCVIWLGDPGVYVTEPHFVGGVWRIAALQVGGALGLLDAAATVLRTRGRLSAPAQMDRLATAVIAAMAASALVTRAALAAVPDAPDAADRAPILSAAARLATEGIALDAIRTVEQSIGLPHFEAGSVTGRKARDLSVYLRQAARDALQTRVGAACFAEGDDLWTYL